MNIMRNDFKSIQNIVKLIIIIVKIMQYHGEGHTLQL